jgi:sugar O-acyltransferase (sialic acid O-acetyltransferase NeuD family)
MQTKKVWPQYTEKMINNVSEILKSGKVNQWTGNKVKEFEKKYAEYFGVKWAIAVTNGTVAIDLCLRAIGLQHGDEVIVTPRSFLASATAISTCGGIPVFVDVDINTQNITLDNIKKGISKKTKAVILVHLAGITCDCEEIVEWCHKHHIYVIEDCAQCHGAKYNNKYAGTFGDINAWSFCQDKIISTGGEGGMVTTNNEELFKKAWSYKDHGKNYDKILDENSDLFKNEPPRAGFFRNVHDSIGTNFRMTEIQASLGLDSLELLDEWIQIRRKNAKQLSECLKKYHFLEVLEYNEKYYHCYYKYYFYVKDSILGHKQIRDFIIQEFIKAGISAIQGSCSEIYKEGGYKNLENHRVAMDCVNARNIIDRCVLLQTDPTYTEIVMEDFIKKIDSVLQNLQKHLLYIIGCGGHSRVTTDVAIDCGCFIIGYLDDNYEKLNEEKYNYRGYNCIGKISDFNKCYGKFICGLGNINSRKEIIAKLDNVHWKKLIHPSAIISPTVTIGEGTLIMPRVVINSNTIIGKHNIINTASVVEHDCVIGDNTHIAPNNTICGNVKIGECVFYGAGCVTKNSTHEKKIRIGNNVTIGCGSVVLKSVEDGLTVYGKI